MQRYRFRAAHQRAGSNQAGLNLGLGPIVISYFMPVILCFTVVASVSFGVVAAYVAVLGILSSFGRAPQPEPQPARPRLILLATQNHASGD